MQKPPKIILGLAVLFSLMTVATLSLTGAEVWAQESPALSGSLKKVEQLNQKKIDCVVCSSAVAGYDNASISKCQADICGVDSLTALDMYTKYSVQAARMPDSQVQELSNAFDQLMTALDEARKRQFDEVQKAFQNPHIALDPALHDEAAYQFFSAYENLLVTKIEAQKDGSAVYKINESESKERLSRMGLGRKGRQWFINYAKALYSRMDAASSVLPPEIYLKKIYPTLTQEDATRKIAQDYQEIAGREGKALQELGFSNKSADGSQEVIQKALAKKELSSTDVQALINLRNIMLKVQTMTSPEFKKISDQIPLTDIEELINQPNFRKNILDYLKVQKEMNLKRQVDEVKDRCLIIAKINQLILPTEDEKKSFTGVIADVKKSITERVTVGFSESSKKAMDAQVMSNRFLLPSSAAENKKYNLSMLNELTGIVRREGQSEGQPTDGVDKGQFVALGSLHLNSVDRILDLAETSCNAQMAPVLNDANYTSSGAIQVSWVTLKDPTLGAAIIAHEMGHTIFHTPNLSKESSKKRQAIVDCLDHKHRNGIGKHTDEDFADLISAQASSKNASCLFPLNTSAEQSLKGSKSDAHSSNLFRLLNIQSEQKGSIPQSCQDYIKSKGETADFTKSCF
jgi:hypothetical protein